MDLNTKEQFIDNILMYMKNELELEGANIRQKHFYFEPEHTVQYFGHPDEKIEAQEDLIKFRKQIDINDDELNVVIRACFTNEYIKRIVTGDEFSDLKMTDKGLARANSIEKSKLNENKTKPQLETTSGNNYTVNIGGNVTGSAILSENATVANIENSFNEMLKAIEESKSSEKEKEEAKGYLVSLLESPALNYILSNSDKIIPLINSIKI